MPSPRSTWLRPWSCGLRARPPRARAPACTRPPSPPRGCPSPPALSFSRWRASALGQSRAARVAWGSWGGITGGVPCTPRHYATLPLAEAVAKVRAALEEDGGRLLSPGGEGFERKVSSGKPERRLNVVLISVESLGAEFLGAYGDPRGLTPNLDRLSRERLWFAKGFATR